MPLIKEITANDFSKAVLNKSHPVLVNFYSDWNALCLSQDLVVKKFALNNNDGIEVVKIDVDRFPELAQSYSITSIPAQILFNNGKAILAKVNEKKFEQVFDLDDVA